MNALILFSMLAMVAVCTAEKYTDRYDNLDVEAVMKNKRLFDGYMNCVLEQGKCTAEGKEMKIHIKDAMQTSCSKCTDQQRQKARLVVNHIKTNEKNYWEQLKAKYDPGDKYKEIYEAFLAASD